MSGAIELQAPADETILLLFLMVGCAIFWLRPRTYLTFAYLCQGGQQRRGTVWQP